MSGPTNDEELQKWHRWFAVESNNRAWRLSEAASRSDAEDNEMLNAAHAAAFHWSKVGTEIHAARVVRSHSRTRFSQMQRPLRMMRRCTPNTTRRRKKWPGLAEC